MVRLDRRGQMKIQQMAFMLIAVTLLFVLAGLFIVTLRFSGLEESAEALDEKNALLLAGRLADSPEFSCESAFGEARTNCVDMDKVMALKYRIAEGKYTDFWRVDGIEIRKVYPVEEIECTYDNYPECGKITLLAAETGTGVGNFVSLCRKEFNEAEGYDWHNKCELGRIIITYNEDE